MKKIYKDIIDNIPDYQEFLTLDELDESSRRLAEKYPDVVKLKCIGHTRKGHELLCLEIGEGEENALVFGCPHPNEPIGTMLIEHFSEQLASNETFRESLGFKWHIIKAWDADGYRLNEGWIKGPFSVTNYAKHFYRPPSYMQVEWTFPIDYKDYHFHNTLPESDAMRKLIADIEPKFSYSLHNSGFGGTYWYMTNELNDEVYGKLYDTADQFEVPVHKGNPESSSLKAFSQAIYEADGIDSTYEYLLKNGIEDVHDKISGGNCSDQFSRKHFETFTLLTELPYFYDVRIGDTSPSNCTRREAFIDMLDFSDEINNEILSALEIVKPYMNKNNPFLCAVTDFTKDVYTKAQRNQVNNEDYYDEIASEAEKFDCHVVSKFYKLLTLGMLVRAYNEELDKMLYMDFGTERHKTLLTSKDKAENLFATLSETIEDALDYKVISIKQLVSIQLQCGLIVADHIKNRVR